jgi:hypothetical protein
MTDDGTIHSFIGGVRVYLTRNMLDISNSSFSGLGDACAAAWIRKGRGQIYK